MYEAEQLSGLIGKIYDSALDPALWAEALPQVARFVGGPSAGVWSEDVASKSANVIAVSGFDAGYVKAYVTQYANFDPSPSAFCLAKVGEPFARSRIAPDDEFFRTRYFREWVRPQGLADCVYVVLDKCGPSTTLFAVSRRKHDGPVDEHMNHRVRVIAPHLRRAALIGRAIDLERHAAANFVDALDGLSTAMFFVDASAHIVHANAHGRRLLSAAEVLTSAGSRLVASSQESSESLQKLLLTAGMDDRALGHKGVSLPLVSSNGEDYVAHVLPLAVGPRRGTGKARAAAAVFVGKAGSTAPSVPEVIARRYKLTPMELRVVLAIVEVGGGISDAADQLDVSAETVKTHLGNIYGKTGVKRQADLIKLALRFSTLGIG